MILGSHNSWSYLKPKKWWMRLLGFTARCQSADIITQYEQYNVRCFDLRLRFNSIGEPIVCHGAIEYQYNVYSLLEDLEWLSERGDVIIRLLLDLRGLPESKWKEQRAFYKNFYRESLKPLKLKYILGRDLPAWRKCLPGILDGSVEENYASVRSPKYLDDWFPYMYAKANNKKIKEAGTEKDILLLDFVNI